MLARHARRADASAWMVWLRAPGAGPVVTLAWHPQGHLLAGASPGASGFCVWDAAAGTPTPVAVRAVDTVYA